MNIFRNLGSALRKLTVLFLIIALVSFFLFLYYYRYVPDNRDRLQRLGFLILKQDEAGFKQSMMDLANYFATQKLFLADSGEVIKKVDTFNFSLPIRFGRKILRHSQRVLKNSDTITTWPKYDYISGKINFFIPGSKFDVRYTTTFGQIYRNILENSRKTFFESYFIVDSWKDHLPDSHSGKKAEKKSEGKDDGSSTKDETAHVVYHSQSISIADELQTDSISELISHAEFPRIIDLRIGGRAFKAFIHPFQFWDSQANKNTLTIVGLIDRKSVV